ncbi:MAG: LptF/LptG family permease [Haliscomenobacter sp.]|nr:LptF/LptG family permease [Haliscomenobacter sp.]
MKRLDRLVLLSFLPPFVVAFAIALFVLLMQVLWLYMDELTGKGLGVFMIIELIFYRSVGIIPMALPLGMLLASVMVMGNFGERYELSSMKSAGISLLRVMRPLMVFGFGASIFSWYCSDTLIPIANLKFGSRMYDIQQKKPALRMEEGVFNDDFQNFAIHIGKRMRDGRTVKDVLIYDHSEGSIGKVSQVSAEKGEMFATPDGRYFVMKLTNGHQYVQSATSSSSRYPFVRTSFREYTKIFDLSEFQLNRTNEELFKSSRQMMSASQLKVASDSIAVEMDKRVKSLSNFMASYVQILEMDSTYLERDTTPDPNETVADSRYVNVEYVPDQHAMVPVQIQGTPIPRKKTDLKKARSFIETIDDAERENLFIRADNIVRSIQNQAETTEAMLVRMEESRVKHVFDRHSKYSIALACFIFLFIGAPMGAIIRKGGFGYPILVSTVFFMLFVVITIFCRKIAESFILTPEAAAWVPCAILFPTGWILTVRAMRDARMMNVGWLGRLLKPIGRWLRLKKKAVA